MMRPARTQLEAIVEAAKEYGKVKIRKIPCTPSISEVDDMSLLHPQTHSVFRSIVGRLLYVCPELPAAQYATIQLAGRMSAPTERDFQHLQHLAGYIVHVMDWGFS